MNINQIAKLAGVTKRTVTRAINDQYGISEATKARVLAVARKHNYRPSAAARSLTTKRTNTLGLLIPQIENPFFARLTRAVEDVADQHGYGIFLMNTARDRDKELRSIHLCVEKGVDGILLTPVQTEGRQSVDELRRARIPFVLLNRHFDGVKADHVINDNVVGGFLATSHLLEHGYQRIAYLASALSISSSKERLEGYRKALRQHKRPFAAELVLETPLSVEGGERSCEQLMSLSPRPDAFFTFDDVVAAGVARALKKRRLRPGKDVGLVGYDDVELASLLEVPLTTVHQPSYDIGRTGMEILLARIGARPTKSVQQVVLKPWLTVRESCGCGPSE